MDLAVIRWPGTSPPTEADLRNRLDEERLDYYEWSNGPGYHYPAHVHDYDKILYVIRGSITWVFATLGERMETRAGDRIELPRNTSHAAEVGPEGAACLEAHRM